MAQPITAVYVRDEEDYTVTVAGEGQEFTDKAPGIIAARDRADQLIEKIAPGDDSDEDPTVVHLLNGSAFEFTSAYITARLSRAEVADGDESASTDDAAADDTTSEAEATKSADVDESDTEDAEVAESEAAEVVADDGEAAEAGETGDDTDDVTAGEAAEGAADAETTAEADAGEDTTAHGTAPGSGVPRKEITKSPAASGTASTDDDSDDTSYAAVTSTSASG